MPSEIDDVAILGRGYNNGWEHDAAYSINMHMEDDGTSFLEGDRDGDDTSSTWYR